MEVDWGAGHEVPRFDMSMAFIAQAIRERYPHGQLPSLQPGSPLQLNTIQQTDGWLGQANTYDSGVVPITWPEIAPYGAYSQDPNQAAWLVNETMAMVYRAHNEWVSAGVWNQPLELITHDYDDDHQGHHHGKS